MGGLTEFSSMAIPPPKFRSKRVANDRRLHSLRCVIRVLYCNAGDLVLATTSRILIKVDRIYLRQEERSYDH